MATFWTCSFFDLVDTGSSMTWHREPFQVKQRQVKHANTLLTLLRSFARSWQMPHPMALTLWAPPGAGEGERHAGA